MGIPVSYSFRNLLTRRLTTALTVAGMALVVFVFASILMLSDGLRTTLVKTGSPDNAVVLRKGTVSEVMSGVERDQAAVVETQPEVASGQDGTPLAAKELVVLISLTKRGTDKPSNVVIRGVDKQSMTLRPQVRLISGRAPRPGSAEIMAGMSISRRFTGTGLGEDLRFGGRDWTVVGVFDAGATGFSSEVWGDVEQLMQAFRRPVYSSVIFRLKDQSSFESFKGRIESDPRMTIETKREIAYYEEQSRIMAKFLSIMGMSLTAIFSIGAIIGAMITMYASVANRTAEIGTLRALGFSRRSILAAFVMESLLLGLLGGCAGLFCASFLQFFTISTMNFQTFSELAFSFNLSVAIAAGSIGFSLLMGLIGGFLPAVRASRMTIVEALRTG